MAKPKRKKRLKISKKIRKKILLVLTLFCFFVFGFAAGYFSFSFWQKPILAQNELSVSASKTKPLINKVVFGKSVAGKDISGYEIGNGEKTIFLFGSIHGNEMGSDSLLERFVIDLEQQPFTLAKGVKLIVVPTVNPDGYYDREDKLNANGVNLNLNFDTTGWKQYGGEENNFAGNQPFSEPESNVIKKIVEENNVVEMISFHAEGGISVPENNDASVKLAKWYAKKSGYTYDDASYDYSGTATKWFAEKKGGAAITVELSNHFGNDWDKNRDALLGLAAGMN